jgi:hypothetical protein
MEPTAESIAEQLEAVRLEILRTNRALAEGLEQLRREIEGMVAHVLRGGAR